MQQSCNGNNNTNIVIEIALRMAKIVSWLDLKSYGKIGFCCALQLQFCSVPIIFIISLPLLYLKSSNKNKHFKGPLKLDLRDKHFFYKN